MSVLGALVSLIYKSFFLKGDVGFRLAPPLAKLLLLASILFTYVRAPTWEFAIFLTAIAIAGLISPGFQWLYSALTLSGIVAAYMSLTALLLSVIGITSAPLSSIPFIFIRSLYISFSLMFLFSTISPLDIANLMNSLGMKRACLYPALVWRVVPFSLKAFLDSIQLAAAKGEGVIQRIPPATAAILEAGTYFDEYNYARLESPLPRGIKLRRSAGYAYALLLLSIILLALSLVV